MPAAPKCSMVSESTKVSAACSDGASHNSCCGAAGRCISPVPDVASGPEHADVCEADAMPDLHLVESRMDGAGCAANQEKSTGVLSVRAVFHGDVSSHPAVATESGYSVSDAVQVSPMKATCSLSAVEEEQFPIDSVAAEDYSLPSLMEASVEAASDTASECVGTELLPSEAVRTQSQGRVELCCVERQQVVCIAGSDVDDAMHDGCVEVVPSFLCDGHAKQTNSEARSFKCFQFLHGERFLGNDRCAMFASSQCIGSPSDELVEPVEAADQISRFFLCQLLVGLADARATSAFCVSGSRGSVGYVQHPGANRQCSFSRLFAVLGTRPL